MLSELLDGLWIKGEAEERGISVPEKRIAAELGLFKEQSYPTPEAYSEFLKASKLSEEDVEKRLELRLLGEKVQKAVNGEAPEPSDSAISAYYEAAKSATFTTSPSRDIRVVTSKSKADVEAAKKELEENQSSSTWQKVASKYSEDPTTQDNGGLQKGLVEDIVPEPLKAVIFGTQVGEVVGPTRFSGKFTLIEVVKRTPESVQRVDEARPQIQEILTDRAEEEFFSEFLASYQKKWASRTHCAEGYTIERCANYKGNGHPALAPDACYEADPEKPAAECPAPVIQHLPVTPGTISILKPLGEHLVQRPRPSGED